MTVERGLSPNTVKSYGSDLLSLADFLQERNITSWSQPDRDTLLDFLDFLRDKDMDTTSIARHLTAIKMFYRYLAGEKLVDEQDDILIITDDATIIRMAADRISLLGRATQGVRVMRLIEGSRVISIEKTEKAVEEEAEPTEE